MEAGDVVTAVVMLNPITKTQAKGQRSNNKKDIQ